jgi:WD40 repeat protein
MPFVRGYQNGAGAIAFSPDGRLIACPRGSGLTCFALNDGAPALDLRALGSLFPSSAIVFLDGGRIAGGRDHEVFVADLATRAAIWTEKTFIAPAGEVAAPLDGRVIVELDEKAVGFDGATGEPLWNWPPWGRLGRGPRCGLLGPRPLRVAVPPGGRIAAVACEDGTIRTLDLATGAPLGSDGSGPAGDVRRGGLAFSPCGRFLAAGGEAALVLYEVDASAPGGRVLRRSAAIGHAKAVHSIAFTPDGAHIASASADEIVIRDLGWRCAPDVAESPAP